MHTNVYAVYARGCSLSVTCQVVMVNTTRDLGSGIYSSDLCADTCLGGTSD